MRSRGAVCACGDVVLAVVVVLQLLPLPCPVAPCPVADGGFDRFAMIRITYTSICGRIYNGASYSRSLS